MFFLWADLRRAKQASGCVLKSYWTWCSSFEEDDLAGATDWHLHCSSPQDAQGCIYRNYQESQSSAQYWEITPPGFGTSATRPSVTVFVVNLTESEINQETSRWESLLSRLDWSLALLMRVYLDKVTGDGKTHLKGERGIIPRLESWMAQEEEPASWLDPRLSVYSLCLSVCRNVQGPWGQRILMTSAYWT